jgi:hypothetical protein
MLNISFLKINGSENSPFSSVVAEAALFKLLICTALSGALVCASLTKPLTIMDVFPGLVSDFRLTNGKQINKIKTEVILKFIWNELPDIFIIFFICIFFLTLLNNWLKHNII